ncbi:hypothetical protein [Bremerella sp. P1]|uniref:hypothetical protein n=1 Tax=Bremerella sp. P1 TaxID=3026424 RepID=UPI0023688157|nr:hypothetical protein [Bremerella sp. P1]WDI42214.1 hypothetical protein PSR63_27565 [Bremerella sp. P1]
MSSAPEPSQTASPDEGPLFFVKIPEGQIFGPVPSKELDQWVQEGRIDRQCELRRTDSQVWEKSDQRYPILALPEQVGSGSPFHQVKLNETNAPYQLPHRGIPSLIFALVGLLGVCPIFSIAAWSMAHSDLEEIDKQHMNPNGRVMLLWANYLGMAGVIGYGILFLGFLLVAMLRMLL